MEDIFGNNIENIDLDDIKKVKEQLRKIEKEVKKANKPKTITISAKVHQKIKKYCETHGHNIGEWVEKIATDKIKGDSCIIEDDRTHDEIRESDIENLKIKYKASEINSDLFKSKVGILSNKVSFKGYSAIDGDPIYETFCKKSIEEVTDIKDVKSEEISSTINPDDNMDFIII